MFAWEQRKLGEIGKVFTGNTPSTKNTENWTTDKSIGHVWITPTDINNNIMFDSERYLSDKGWSQARVVPKNSVLITSIASIGKNAINGVEVAFNQQINALVVQKNNPYFILTLMNKEKQRFESLAGQTATPIINKSTFSSFMVKIPSETEQEQIGEFFKQLDSLIALHQRKPFIKNGGIKNDSK
ncbi:putative restriction modification system DNA specificity subunit [Ligilactobacillus salivarius GJ-24]|uniref:Putative restriction modification system DNA specificity subunit n=1 Tax=Ligilactobacillus salivarius GJ-24 TaxID=1041521 RepID=F7QS20_9LACO|nr:putative restriction modification system DNA specificity subunit [Ligilactobacillus salivarius GJ-24]